MSNAATTTKIFMAGGSQAVRIPMDLRFGAKVSEVLIRRDPLTGSLVVTQKPAGWAQLFSYLDHLATPDEAAADQLRLQLGAGEL